MDYMETVLRRQNGFWSALLTGRSKDSERPGERFLAPEDVAELDIQIGAQSERVLTRRRNGGEAMADLARQRLAGAEESGADRDMARLQAEALERRSWAVREATLDDWQAEKQMASVENLRSGQRVASRAAVETEARMPEEWALGGSSGDSGLCALSLTLERDTRRFDSGFSLY